MDVRLNDEAMQQLVTKAIFDGLTEEKRDELVQASIKHLLETPKQSTGYGYGEKTTRIQEIFYRAAADAAENIIRDRFKDDTDFKAKFEALFAEVAERFFAGDEHSTMVEKMASNMRYAFTRDRY